MPLTSAQVRHLRGDASAGRSLNLARAWSRYTPGPGDDATRGDFAPPQDVTVELERCGSNEVLVATVFLTGAECPFTCVFCDLWRHTLEGATPEGSIPAQIRWALRSLNSDVGGAHPTPTPSWIKLYNASNFFEQRAVPESDDQTIIEILKDFERVVVECHPRVLLGARGRQRATRYARELPLEIALGLESVAPGALEALNKGASLDDFERAFEMTLHIGASIRVFVLYGIPLLTGGLQTREADREQARWTIESLLWARARGARCATIIPVRGGNGALEELQRRGWWQPPTLEGLEDCFDRALELERPDFDVHLDLWDLERVATRCPSSLAARLERIRQAQRRGYSRGAAMPSGPR